jgi:hypothetical protein
LGRTESYGTHALTFMIRGLAEPWKIPISFFISANSAKGANQAIWLKKIIPKLFEVGLILKLVVCDQGTNNQSTLKHMGITYTEPFYRYNNEKVYFKYDDPHIIKCIRNQVRTHNDIFVNGKKISWTDIEMAFKIDSELEAARHMLKLNLSHLTPNSFQKMNCRLAIQTLSGTVAATIKTFLEDGRLKSDTALNTVNFISKVDEIFDALNSATLYSKKKTRSGVSNENYWIIDTLKSVEGWVGSIKRSMDGQIAPAAKNKTKKQTSAVELAPCFHSLKLSARVVLLLFDELVTQENTLNYLLTRRMNQDPLENFFSIIRRRGGYDRNPTAFSFKNNMRHIFLSNLKSADINGNCEEDDDIFLTPMTGLELSPATELHNSNGNN